jgi:hypothetical protein
MIEARFVLPEGIIRTFFVDEDVEELVGKTVTELSEEQGPVGDAAREELATHRRSIHKVLNRPEATLEI